MRRSPRKQRHPLAASALEQAAKSVAVRSPQPPEVATVNKLARPFLSVVIPAFNEAERIPQTLAMFLQYLHSLDYAWEIIVVDDGSSDRTVDVVEAIAAAQLIKDHMNDHPIDTANDVTEQDAGTGATAKAIGQIKLIKLPTNQGKGSAVRTGVLASRGEQVLFSDADGSTPLPELFKLQAQLASGYEIAIGTRRDQTLVSKRQPFYRTILGEGFNWLARLTIGAQIQDTQCGFKLIKGDLCRSLFAQMQIPGFGFDVELLYLAHRAGSTIAQVPVVWRNDTRSKVNVFRDPLLMFVDLVRIRLMH
ncbi:Dolichyl-phosphate beta-glucosyltransferase [Thalassoporum mexicanum PCC 7367]|nr:Dolichyl-phosphate beta-glucosyltransferase [Pseudanabaena sp. PCC 7367]